MPGTANLIPRPLQDAATIPTTSSIYHETFITTAKIVFFRTDATAHVVTIVVKHSCDNLKKNVFYIRY